MAEIRGDGLLAIFKEVVVTAGSTQERRCRRVKVASLRPRDVTAVLEVVAMAKAQEGAGRLKIVNQVATRGVEKAGQILLMLESALLPSLCVFPSVPNLVTALETYIRQLSKFAARAGGQFSTKAEELCVHLREYVRNADVLEDDKLRVRADTLIDEVRALLDGDVTISDT